jgi:cyclopropane fatty-acyl-phospholipid synthase-like methyltransferase
MNGVSYLDDIAEIVSLEKRGLSPISPEKVVAVGHVLGLNERSRVIDFGCGMGEDLCQWGSRFGISGVGVELNEGFCTRARERLARLELDRRIEIVCMNAAEYEFEKGAFDAATCLGASFIFGGYRGTLRRLSRAIRPGGKIAIGEPYYVDKVVPPELAAYEGDCRTEAEIFQITREEGYEVEYATRATADDWERYVAGNWHQTLRWLREHPGAPDRQQRIEALHRDQDAYPFRLRYQGFAVCVLSRL